MIADTQTRTVAFLEQDEFAYWYLTLVEDDGNLTQLFRSYDPIGIIKWANRIGIQIVNESQFTQKVKEHK